MIKESATCYICQSRTSKEAHGLGVEGPAEAIDSHQCNADETRAASEARGVERKGWVRLGLGSSRMMP